MDNMQNEAGLRKAAGIRRFRTFLICRLPWVLLGIFFIIPVLYYAFYGESTLTSDISAQMMLAAHMNAQHTILPPTDWYYSTQLMLFSIWPYQVGLLLFKSWHLARTCALSISLALIPASYLCFARLAGLSRRGIWSALAFVSTFGTSYTYWVITGMMYPFGIIYPLVALSAFLLLSRRDSLRHPWAGHILLAAVSFGFALEGIRIFLTFSLPLLGAGILLTFFDLAAQPDFNFASWRRGETARFLFYSLESFAFSIAGYLVNAKVLSSLFSYSSYSTLLLAPFSVSSILSMLDGTVQLFGYDGNVPAFSLGGIRSLLALFLFFLGLVALVYVPIVWKKCSVRQRFVLLFCISGLLVGIFGSALSGLTDTRYMIPSFLYFFPLMHIVWDCKPFRSGFIKQLLCAAFVCSLIVINSRLLMPLLLRQAPASNALNSVAVWLVDNGYDKGYATFWSAGQAVEVTDGRLEIWATTPSVGGDVQWQAFPLFHWLQDKAHEEAPEGTIFVLLSDEELAEDPTVAHGGEMVYHKDGYAVFLYESSEAMYAAASGVSSQAAAA